jgi:hypothetical protein
MTDILYAIWAVLSFFLGIVWSVGWFVLRDLLSTLLWIVIVIWLGFVIRYRSFGLGTLALLRYARTGLVMIWRWLRGRPSPLAAASPPRERVTVKYRERVPAGYVSLSEQMNIIMVLFFVLASL